ncbi:MAG: hypothetical protein ACI9Y8_001726 [Candidatus Omnitrophota bacterium]|jgi:hypothetical protein
METIKHIPLICLGILLFCMYSNPAQAAEDITVTTFFPAPAAGGGAGSTGDAELAQTGGDHVHIGVATHLSGNEYEGKLWVADASTLIDVKATTPTDVVVPDIILQNTSNTNNNYNRLLFVNSVGGVDSAIAGSHEDANATGTALRGNLKFLTANAAGLLPRMTLASTGNVGIGTETPSEKLSISRLATDTSNPTLEISSATSTTYDPTLKLTRGSSAYYGLLKYDTGLSDMIIQNTNSASTSDIRFQTSGSNDRMVITGNGNVGIGTTSPNQKLVVSGNEYITGNLGIGVSSPTQKLAVSGNGYLTGSLGIGVTSPSKPLHVAGQSQFENLINLKGITAGSIKRAQILGDSTTDSVRFGGGKAGGETMLLYPYGNGELNFMTTSGTATQSVTMELNACGDVAIGLGNSQPLNCAGNAAAYKLHVRDRESLKPIVVFENGNTSSNPGKTILKLHFPNDSGIHSSKDKWISFYDAGGMVGSITGEVSYRQFTGGHVGQTDEDFSTWKPGMIVSATGEMITKGISRALPKIRLSNGQKDKAAIGVFTETEFPHDISGFDRDKPAINYNALGEGLILVTDTGGDISVGDWIQSSPRAGYGEKQSDDVFHNYSVAKASEPVIWDNEPTDSQTGFKVKMVACTYHAG